MVGKLTSVRRDRIGQTIGRISDDEAVPQDGSKKGADRGIDGIRWVRTGPREGDLGRVIVSVKGGENIGVKDVRDLVGTV